MWTDLDLDEPDDVLRHDRDDLDFLDDDEIDEDEDETTLCVTCSTALPDDHDDDAYGEQCQACYAASHFYCVECESDYELDERSATNPALCQACQDTKDEEAVQEALDDAKDEARELLESILDSDDLDAVKKAVRALKRLQPPTSNPEGTAK